MPDALQEFTGERVVPGQVEPDLWNEHFCRYLFAQRHARNRRVADLGCGTGYGTAELARVAAHVVGVDVSSEAVRYAQERYGSATCRFVQGSATAVPIGSGAVDLVVAFEVLEHLESWQALLSEAKRMLSRQGLLLVSTPNRLYYAESRGESGPNPYHVREFAREEFRQALLDVFPAVALYEQSHSACLLLRPESEDGTTGEAHLATGSSDTEPHFFLALCGEQLPSRLPYVHVPSTANVLQERSRHVERLRAELSTKDHWLKESLHTKASLMEEHRALQAELEQRTAWALQTGEELTQLRQRFSELYNVMLQQQEQQAAEFQAQVSAYQGRVAELDQENVQKTEWALSLERQLAETEARLSGQLSAQCEQLRRCVELLHGAEATVAERTQWALDLQGELERMQATLAAVGQSRWLRLGRTLRVGPEVVR